MLFVGKESAKFRSVVAIAALLFTAIALLHYSPPNIFGRQMDDFGPPSGSTNSVPAPVGSVHGFLADETGSPVIGVEVELIPADKTGEAQWYATIRCRTEKDGSYTFTQIPPGEYLLAWQHENAPDGEHPFGSRFYPGVENERSAERIVVVADESAELDTIALHRIETVSIPVEIAFADGTRPSWSNLLFSNTLYHNQAVIGDVAPGVADGRGEIVLPLGFEYSGRAKVDCDAGTKIETHESDPVQIIDLKKESDVPQKLSFVVSGSACKLWTAK